MRPEAMGMGMKGKLSTHGNKRRTKRLIALKNHAGKMAAKKRKRAERCEASCESDTRHRKVSPITRIFLAPIVQMRARFL